MTDLGTLGGSDSHALAVNSLGQVVGYSATASGTTHGFLWRSGSGMTDLGALGGSFSLAVAVNDLAQVVGWSAADDGNLHGFLWQSGSAILDLGTLGNVRSTAVAVNALSQVVGSSATASDMTPHAFLWQSGTGMTDLGIGQAVEINDQGQIVGWKATAGGQAHAALWNTLVPATPAEQVMALRNAVTALATAGTLDEGQANSLQVKLDAISRQLDIGNKTAATNLLQAFINGVRALTNAGIMSASDGQTLINSAQHLISQIKT
jgi:probable HAF family extracellular repeat protein